MAFVGEERCDTRRPTGIEGAGIQGCGEIVEPSLCCRPRRTFDQDAIHGAFFPPCSRVTAMMRTALMMRGYLSASVRYFRLFRLRFG